MFFYRASARQAAQAIGIRGWVRNLSDGRVESVACGDEDKVRDYEQWLYQGPKHAKVTAVHKHVAACVDAGTFAIKPTA